MFNLTEIEITNILLTLQDDGGWTPIIWASEHKLVSTVKFLLNQGAQSTLKDKVSTICLWWGMKPVLLNVNYNDILNAI